MHKAKEVTNKLAENNSLRRKIFKGISSVFILLSVVYVYLIGSITFNGVAKRSLENSSRELVNTVSQLELSYLSLSNSIDKSYASSIGYVDAHNTFVVTRAFDRVAVR